MRPRRPLLFILGVTMLALGVLFAAQGSGVFPYPRSSFMIAAPTWIWRGLGLALCGVAVILVAGRRR